MACKLSYHYSWKYYIISIFFFSCVGYKFKSRKPIENKSFDFLFLIPCIQFVMFEIYSTIHIRVFIVVANIRILFLLFILFAVEYIYIYNSIDFMLFS